jgi:hypothetical protein
MKFVIAKESNYYALYFLRKYNKISFKKFSIISFWTVVCDIKIYLICSVKKGEIIPVTGHGDPWGCETTRLPQFLDNRLTDGGEVVGLERQPPFTPRKIPGIHFC